MQYFGARIHTRFERIQAMFSDISAQAEENFSGARLIRAFAQEEAQIALFETSNLEYIRRSLLLARLMAMLWPTLEFVLGISLMITLLVGAMRVVLHHITVGEFTTYSVYMVQLTWPMIAIGWGRQPRPARCRLGPSASTPSWPRSPPSTTPTPTRPSSPQIRVPHP